jgi:hypothetical protein
MQVGHLLIEKQTQPNEERHILLLAIMVHTRQGRNVCVLNHVGFGNAPRHPLVQTKMNDPFQTIVVMVEQFRQGGVFAVAESRD